MRNTKEDSYIVVKRKDLHNLTTTEQDIVEMLLNKARGLKPTNKYYVVNTDEPYADEVLQTILIGERQKRPEFKDLIIGRLKTYLGEDFIYHYDDGAYNTMAFTIDDFPLAEPNEINYFKLANTILGIIEGGKKYLWCIGHLNRTTDRDTYMDTYTGEFLYREAPIE